MNHQVRIGNNQQPRHIGGASPSSVVGEMEASMKSHVTWNRGIGQQPLKVNLANEMQWKRDEIAHDSWVP